VAEVPVQRGRQCGSAGLPVGYALADERGAAAAWLGVADEPGADQGAAAAGYRPLELLSACGAARWPAGQSATTRRRKSAHAEGSSQQSKIKKGRG